MTGEIESLADGVRLSLSALAKEFGYARETIKSRLDKGGVRPDGQRRGNPVFRLRDCIGPLTQQTNGRVEDPEALPPMERRAWFASEKDRLITEREQHNLIPAEAHRASLAYVIQSTAQMLDTLADVLERDCNLAPNQVEKIEQVIDVQRMAWADLLEEEDQRLAG